jgi:deoxyadenosine/deoxycytidine kinase
MRVLSLEGNIGSGKSTLLRALAQQGLRVSQEPVDEWSAPSLPDGRGMLQAFYDDKKKNAFAFQMYVLDSRVRQVMDILAAQASHPADAVVTERCLASDSGIFAAMLHRSGNLSDVERVSYESAVATMRRLTAEAEPAAVVYLRTSPDVCARRVAARARDGESSVDVAYLSSLHEAHEAYVARLSDLGVPVLVLDGNQDGQNAVDAHAGTVRAYVTTRIRG